MSLENLSITKTDDLPIRHEGNVHNGKVRSVYWLNKEDSRRIGKLYGVENSQIGIMVDSDTISAFECLWHGETLKGVPGKGAVLNAVSDHWFDRFEQNNLAGNHILGTPHPLVWIVRKAEPIFVEAIARQYITGSMWRDYDEKSIRNFCGNRLLEGLEKDQDLGRLLITPTTKGVIAGIPGIPEADDVNITKQQILDNYRAFGFKSAEDVAQYETLLRKGFVLIREDLDSLGLIFVDTKFEFGYAKDSDGKKSMIYIDEVGTPDSSRYWSKDLYAKGEVVEKSKEFFRQILLNGVPERDVLLNKKRMDERRELAQIYRVKDEDMMATSELYIKLAEQITGKPLPKIENPREEIIVSLEPFGIIEKVE